MNRLQASVARRHLLRKQDAFGIVRTLNVSQRRTVFAAPKRERRPLINTNRLPRIFQPETWQAILPSSLRTQAKELFSSPAKSKSYNPASYFIWIYILIGSQAIRIIQIKNEHKTFVRQADLQIDKLREVVRKLQAGEEVDIEKALGTGIPEEEEAWEQAMKEIENEETQWHINREKERKERELRDAQNAQFAAAREDASPVSSSSPVVGSGSQPPLTSPGFY